ncbi:MAG TPA: NHL repeat-containing protein [Candidatus Eremiobacteraceae bacterium]|nr:NHL repeat-containing protein [Candidatus Eremiobacteraceae bacterium]
MLSPPRMLSSHIVAAVAALSLAGCASGSVALVPHAAIMSKSSAPGHRGDDADLVRRKICVANSSANSITEYRRAANGNVAPRQDIVGPSTGLSSPSYVALDSAGHVFVTNTSADSVTEYAAGASGNSPPIAAIIGGVTQLSSPQGIALDTAGRVYVANGGSTPYVTVYKAGANGGVAPSQTIYDSTGFLSVAGLAVHGSVIYVANTDFNFNIQVSEYPTTANGIVTAIAQIGGLSAPLGVAVEGNGKIVVADGDAIKVFAANANGNPTPLQTIQGGNTLLDQPAGVAVGASGIFVADGDTPAVTSYHVTANGNTPPSTDVTGAKTKLAAPIGIAVR